MKKIATLLACALALPLAAHAQKVCSAADATAAQKAVDKIVSWQNLEKAWHDYRHCDKDTVDDGFTDALMRLMVGWKNLDAISAAMARDAEYKKWVHKHVLSPAAKDDREDVYALAKKSCPAKQDAFCAELAEVVKPGKPGAAPAAASGDTLFEPLKPIPAPNTK